MESDDERMTIVSVAAATPQTDDILERGNHSSRLGLPENVALYRCIVYPSLCIVEGGGGDIHTHCV